MEQHASLRFARLRTPPEAQPATAGTTDRLILVAYNTVWWIPVVLPVLGIISYRAGLLGFAAVTLVRAAINLYRNNVLPIERGSEFPLRLP